MRIRRRLVRFVCRTGRNARHGTTTAHDPERTSSIPTDEPLATSLPASRLQIVVARDLENCAGATKSSLYCGFTSNTSPSVAGNGILLPSTSMT